MTAHRSISTLRFEEAPISLGDELRGARASSGKTLEQIERELRIKAAYILAIEDARPDKLPDPAYAAGFVRGYARLLGLDPERTLARFQQEAAGVAGAARPLAPLSHGGARDLELSRPAPAAVADVTDSLAALARRNKGAARGEGRILGTLALLTPLALAGLLAWGGWILLQKAGVGALFKIEGETPAVSATVAPAVERPSASAFENGVSAYWTAAKPPPVAPVDAPLSAALAAPAAETAPSGPQGDSRTAADAPVAGAEAAPPAAPPPAAPRWALVSIAPAWMEARAPDGKVVFSGTLQPGQRFEPPAEYAGQVLVLRAGNIGGIGVEIDGVALGPLGKKGQTIKSFPLTPDDLRLKIQGVGASAPASAAPVESAPAAPVAVAPAAAPVPAEPKPIRAPRPAPASGGVENPPSVDHLRKGFGQMEPVR